MSKGKTANVIAFPLSRVEEEMAKSPLTVWRIEGGQIVRSATAGATITRLDDHVKRTGSRISEVKTA
jgi:hypothetical protein